MDTSSYGHVVTMLLLLIALEAPALHFILGAVLQDGAVRGLIRGVLLGSSLYLALWLIGDLRLLRETPGVLLGKDVLVVALGMRVNGEVALNNVTGAECLVAEQAKQAHGSRAIRVTPQPRPNCRIRLDAEAAMRGIFGSRLRGETLEIFVDDPAGLVAAIEAALTQAGD
jgi:hypothetical protein